MGTFVDGKLVHGKDARRAGRVDRTALITGLRAQRDFAVRRWKRAWWRASQAEKELVNLRREHDSLLIRESLHEGTIKMLCDERAEALDRMAKDANAVMFERMTNAEKLQEELSDDLENAHKLAAHYADEAKGYKKARDHWLKVAQQCSKETGEFAEKLYDAQQDNEGLRIAIAERDQKIEALTRELAAIEAKLHGGR